MIWLPQTGVPDFVTTNFICVYLVFFFWWSLSTNCLYLLDQQSSTQQHQLRPPTHTIQPTIEQRKDASQQQEKERGDCCLYLIEEIITNR